MWAVGPGLDLTCPGWRWAHLRAVSSTRHPSSSSPMWTSCPASCWSGWWTTIQTIFTLPATTRCPTCRQQGLGKIAIFFLRTSWRVFKSIIDQRRAAGEPDIQVSWSPISPLHWNCVDISRCQSNHPGAMRSHLAWTWPSWRNLPRLEGWSWSLKAPPTCWRREAQVRSWCGWKEASKLSFLGIWISWRL